MNLFYGILPTAFGLDVPLLTVHEVWIVITTALFVLAFGSVWTRARDMDPVDVVLLGLLVWLLPLRQMYTHYLIWAVIPFLMRGRLLQIVIAGAIVELAHTMAVWSWNIPPNPFPAMDTPYGFFLTSLAYSAFGILAIGLVLKESRSHSQPFRSGGVPEVGVRDSAGASTC